MLIRLLVFLLGAQVLGAEDSALRIAAGYKAELIANETTLSNVVSFSIDEHGRIFVAETRRAFALEISSPDDDTLQSVEDRIELLRKKNALNNTNQSERILLLEDKNDDGQIDLAKVFAKNFNRAIDGQTGGLLARNGEVYFTCAPDLWVLRDNKRHSLHTGFGIHIRNPTHNLRNPTLGPDGRFYFTMGDQGFLVQTHEGIPLVHPDEGAILRCETNGARLEVIARGFTNPQGLAFSEFGDLFVADENRLIHVIEGMHPTNFPPTAIFPSALTSLAQRDGTFYISDTNSIHSLKLKTNGVTFEIDSKMPMVVGAAPNHIDFGPKPGIYFSEFRGRIYRVFTPGEKPSTNTHPTDLSLGQLTATVRNPTNLLTAINALSIIARHARNNDAGSQQVLLLAAKSKEPEIRAQAAKSLGEIKNSQAGPTLVSLLADASPRVHFFAAQSLARQKHKEAQSELSVLSFKSEDPHIRFAATRALNELQK
jgi:quinoprotein glucose dehydrogenase